MHVSSPQVVVHCADRLLRGGITSILRACGDGDVLFTEPDDPVIPRPRQTLLVFPDSGTLGDRFECLQRMPVEWDLGTGPIGVAVVRRPLDQLLVLRLTESGISYLIDYDDVATDPTLLCRLDSQIDDRHRLPTPWELRQRLGLRWDGDLREFCRAIEAVPTGAWIEEWKQARLPISRRSVQRIRRLALDVGGIPPPDPREYSTAYRDAPDTPPWSRVREIVHRLWGLRVVAEHLHA